MKNLPGNLTSIKEIIPEDCFNTRGSHPVKVYCNDGNDYVCKYFNGIGPATGLFNEYLAARFFQLWELNVPDFAFVNIQKHHFEKIPLPHHCFNIPCFGSRYDHKLKEVDKFFLGWPSRKNTIELIVADYLKIGLFDIWLSNDDRNFDNFNLLYNFETNRLIPIDHVQLFNGNNLDRDPYQINENDSILSAPFMNGIFSRTLQQILKEYRLTIEEEFKSYLRTCYENLGPILQYTPPEWRIDSAFTKSRLEFYFSESWQKQCLESFNQFIQYSLNRSL
ncbi:MAG: HipA family kinase [bacterium]